MKSMLIATVLVAMVTTSESDRVAVWYFAPAGVPVATMGAEPPMFGGIPDPDHDGEVGRTLRPGDHQEFLAPGHGAHILGSPSVTVWLRESSGNPDSGGVLRVGLLECVGDRCGSLGEASLQVDRWSPDDGWVAYSIQFPELDHRLEPGSQVCVRFDPGPESTVALAYGATVTPSALLMPVADDGEQPNTGDAEATRTPTSVVPPASTTTTSAPDDRSDLIRPAQRDVLASGTLDEAAVVDVRGNVITVLVGAGLLLMAAARVWHR